MLYSFKLTTPEQSSQTFFTASDGRTTYKLIAGKGTDHYYCNLHLDEVPTIDFPGEHSVTELAFGHTSYLTPEQQERNKDMTYDRGLSYRISVRGTPRRAIITSPQYAGDFGPVTPYAMLRAERFDLDDTLYISFQDLYFFQGSYFLSDNDGNDPVPAAVSLIQEQLDKYGLTGADATFVGTSKGANISALLSQHFEDNQLIVCAYAMDLEHWVRNTGLSHVGTALDYLGISFPDSLAILQREADRKETHWFYSLKDPQSNRGLEDTFTGKFLTKHPSESMHGAVLIDHWDEIRDLVVSRAH